MAERSELGPSNAATGVGVIGSRRTFTFDGGAATYIGTGILALLITFVTAGIALPFALVLRQRWQAKHTYFNGQRLKFVGTGMGLFGHWIKWLFFIVITLGVYSFWVAPRITKWVVEHQELEVADPALGDRPFTFDGGAGTYLGVGILSFVLTFVTFGLGSPWATVMRMRWRAEHTLIAGRRIRFVGTGGALFGQWIKWFLLTLITAGVYSFWLVPRVTKWRVEHQEW